ncbi:uncharacterized protein LOC124267107 [Haliotis rubra]|uniref:uncharacterized protein LOC124267107 n=2 Tax=Haliotis rubra TaxID=36100 RepID=UPI001EE5E9CA|nr:uncharacterized protein LOC124267107 [Haliotis rubra]
MKTFLLVITIGLILAGCSCKPSQLSFGDAVKFLKVGGQISYDLNISKCSNNLPKDIPSFSWGDRVDDVIILDEGTDFSVEFSITRKVNGIRYNLTDRPVRFTQVSISNDQVFVEITDVNEDVPDFLSTGSIQCANKDGGVVVNKLSTPGGEVTTQEDLINHLRMGYDLTYVLQWDKCSPGNTTTNKWWSGRISGYRFGHNGGVSFTQIVDSAQKEFFIEVSVMKSSVKVQMFNIERLQRQQGSTETRMCALGQSYRVFTHQDA